jgi:hypothetical protein
MTRSSAARARAHERARARSRRRALVIFAIGAAGVASVAVVVLLVLRTTSHGTPPAPLITAVLVDRTPSVRGDTATWPGQIAAIAAPVLSRGERLLVGGFAGPTRTVPWLPLRDGRDLVDVTGGAPARKAYAHLYAARLTPFWTSNLTPQSTPRGTNWLGALETASRVKRLREVWLFSDLVQEADGVDLTTPVRADELSAIAVTWGPRMVGLRGLVVHVVGSGQGVYRQRAADRGEQLMGALGHDAGFHPVFESIANVG